MPAEEPRFDEALALSSPAAHFFRVRYLALATDYDDTLASQGAIQAETFAALERLRASGRKLVLVTGRDLDDLLQVCPRPEIFDRIVAENGGLLYRPQSREEVLLAEPPPPSLAERLRARGVDPLTEGRVIVATREPHQTEALDAIRALGLEMQVIFNKGAVMLLPSGVNKQTGLVAALAEMGLSLRNTVAIGDAENDHAMLAAAECGVAVANALPALKDRADLVTRGASGAGVEELIERLLADDLRSLVVPRHALLLGERRDGTAVRIAPSGRRILVAGPSGSGKTTAATGILERLMDQGYQCCVVDPEGDYEGFEGLVGVGTSERPPGIDEVLELLSRSDVHVGVSLLAVAVEDRPGFFSALLPRLQEMRSRVGRPHWIVFDEAHHLFPAGWQPAALTVPRELGGALLITVHPERLARVMLDSVDTAIAVGGQPEDTLRPLGAKSGLRSPPEDGEVVVWSNGQMEPLRLAPGRAQHRRHRRKYAMGDVREKAFVFRGPDGKLNLRAQNLSVFLQMADGVDDDTWTHHLRQNDYSRWFREAIKDEGLAEEARRIETGKVPHSRALIREAVEKRYTLPD
jgi:HAD superfamily hydrolase (TIGR01484 family)